MTATETATRPASPGPAAAAARRSSGRTLVLVGAVLAVALMLAVPVRSWLSQRADSDGLRADIAATQQRVDALAAQKERWEDPRFVSAQARLRLNMVKPGESALIALQRQGEEAEQAPEPAVTTWYGKLWDATRSVAGTGDATGAEADAR